MRDNSPKYNLTLEKKPYPNEMDVYKVLKQQSDIEWSFESFQEDLYRQYERPSPLFFWRYCLADEKDVIEKAFEEIGVQLRIEEIDSPFLFPIGQLSNDRNSWYSGDLVSLSEDALDDWAVANNYSEVYRVTLFPAFDGTRAVRVCSDNITSKEGKAHFRNKYAYESWVPSSKTWLHIQKTIHENNFWEDDTWDTTPSGFSVLDGCTYMIEGYKDGLYKFLYDEGVAEDKAGYVAGEFTNLRPEKP